MCEKHVWLYLTSRQQSFGYFKDTFEK